mgnify:CR=1 FL=1
MRKEVSNKEFEYANNNIDNINIIRKVTSKYNKQIDQDVLKSCGLTALWKCLSYHDNSKGQKFTTNLYKFTDWECKKQLKTQKSQKTMYQFPKNFDIHTCQNKNSEYIKDCMDSLSIKNKEIIQQYFFDNKTMSEVGQMLNISKEAVRQKLNRAISDLKKVYFNLGEKI